MSFDLPVPVLLAIMRLNQRGYDAYAVGGCVRDMLRGVTPHDYDICTACEPQEMHRCFADERVVDTGVKHGTVTVFINGLSMEITSFRSDGDYLDGRHPSFVYFTTSLTEDLQRRDFTINAMAYHPVTGLSDPFGGQEDLRRRLIRCVGDPEQRFTEDALRILRAIRFAAQLGFDVEESTAQAMHQQKERLAQVSRERIASELIRAVTEAGAVPALGAFSDVLLSTLPGFTPMSMLAGLTVLEHLPPGDSVLRMAALLHSCEEPGLQTCLESMHQSRAFQEDVLLLARHARHAFVPEETAVMLSRFGEERLLKLLKLQQACGVLSEQESIKRKTRIRAAQAANLPMSLRELPINGSDLEKMGLEGEQIGEALHKLHLMVLRGQLPCDRASLIAWLIKQKG